MSDTLDKAVNIATLVTCVAIGVMLFRMPGPPRPPQVYQRGEKVTAIEQQHFTQAEKTILLVLRSDCRYCAESMTFYKRLLEVRASRGEHGTHIIAVVLMSDRERAAKYIHDSGLSVDEVVALTVQEQQRLKVAGTPTLVVVDRNAAVTDLWAGKLDDISEQRVLNKLFPERNSG